LVIFVLLKFNLNIMRLNSIILVLFVSILVIVACVKEPQPNPEPPKPIIGIACPGVPVVFDDEGNEYQTVLIGTQCWMRSNLNIGVYVESTYAGSSHTNVSDNEIIEKYCFKNDSTLCAIYGGLYAWHEMMSYITEIEGRGICPLGWHIPSDDEWKEMELTLGISPSVIDSVGYRGFFQGQKLIKNSETNFDALYAGFRFANGQFSHENYYAGFWTSSLKNDSVAWYRGITNGNPQIHRDSYDVNRAKAVRCIKDRNN